MYKTKSRFIQHAKIIIPAKKESAVDYIENEQFSKALKFVSQGLGYGLILPISSKIGIRCHICIKLISAPEVKLHLNKEHNVNLLIIPSILTPAKFANKLFFYYEKRKFIIDHKSGQAFICPICKQKITIEKAENHFYQIHSTFIVKHFNPIVSKSDVFNAIFCQCRGRDMNCKFCQGSGYLKDNFSMRGKLKFHRDEKREVVVKSDLKKCPKCGVPVKKMKKHLKKVHNMHKACCNNSKNQEKGSFGYRKRLISNYSGKTYDVPS